MKKLLIGALVCALLLSLCGVTAAALTVDEIERELGGYRIDWASGEYFTYAEDFSPVGTVGINWDFDASSKLDLTDGNPEDWVYAGYDMTVMDTSNLVSWYFSKCYVWSAIMFAVADPDNLYLAFYVVDPEFTYGDGSSYNGDAIMLGIDFGGLMQKQVETEPEYLTNPKNIFYSFSCAEDGGPLMVMRQESDQDGWLTKEDGVVGSASCSGDGWFVELSMSWDRLFEDYAWKAWDDDAKIYVGSDEELPLNIGLCLYYIDRSETGGAINWAAGTTNGVTFDDGTPAVSWTCYDDGIQLKLAYEEGMYFNGGNICVIPVLETTAPPPEDSTFEPEEETTVDFEEETFPEEETETDYETDYEPDYEPDYETDYETDYEGDYTTPWWEETTVRPVSPDPFAKPTETEPPAQPDTDEETTRRKHNNDDDDDDDDDRDNDRDRDDDISDILEKYGCASVVSAGGMLVLPLLAAAFVFRKKQ
ncbi:MAG: hypothetical protein IKU90_00230 [Clostridia bacterium]|nr:hypothetical protein [Clostridia bacterium]